MASAIVMPKQGNTVEECVLTAWRVAPGDGISEGDIIADIETDKATFEVEATAAGTVLELFWEEGDLVPVLVPICAVGEAGEDAAGLRPDGAAAEPAADTPPEAAAAEPAPATAESAPAPPTTTAANAPLSPRARAFLREHPFELPAIQGSGAGGRIMEQDVAEAYSQAPRLSPVAAALRAEGQAVPPQGSGLSGMIRAQDMGTAAPATPSDKPTKTPSETPAAAAATDAVEEKPLANIRKIIAQRLHESLATTAQYTLNAEADISALLSLRKDLKARRETLQLADATIGDMIMFATVKALLRHPELNVELVDNRVRQHTAVHMGFACDTPRGLMVPVLHHAESLSLGQMSARSKALAAEAIGGSLNPDLLQGGTFTVSNLGALGITTFTPVINTPQVAILGVGTTLLRPVRAADGSIQYRDMLQLSLTLNHMVVDGAPGARFLQTLRAILENFSLVCVAG